VKSGSKTIQNLLSIFQNRSATLRSI